MRAPALKLFIQAAMLFVILCVANGAAVAEDGFQERFGLPREPEPVIKEILARSEFQDQDMRSLMAFVRNALAELVTRAIEWLFGKGIRIPFRPASEAPGLAWRIVQGVLALMLLAIVAVAVRFAVQAYRARRAGTQPLQEESGPSVWLGSQKMRTAALEMAKEGRFREALIYLFRSVLLRLDERGKLAVPVGKTNREILRSLPADEPAREPLAEMIPVFNRVMYGDAPCAPEQYERFRELSERISERT